jgi:AraC-like DNA-binding protein
MLDLRCLPELDGSEAWATAPGERFPFRIVCPRCGAVVRTLQRSSTGSARAAQGHRDSGATAAANGTPRRHRLDRRARRGTTVASCSASTRGLARGAERGGASLGSLSSRVPDAIPVYIHLLRAKDLVDREYARELDVPALARAAHASTVHFSRSFKRAFGETPHRYLQRRRIERAKELLRGTQVSVTEICVEVGFQSLGSFSAGFRELVGEAPSE